MNESDREFLTKKMGEDWYHPKPYEEIANRAFDDTLNRTFDNWTDFGVCWEWATKQEWWPEFYLFAIKKYNHETACHNIGSFEVWFINKDHFPALLVEYLRSRG